MHDYAEFKAKGDALAELQAKAKQLDQELGAALAEHLGLKSDAGTVSLGDIYIAARHAFIRELNEAAGTALAPDATGADIVAALRP